MHSPKTILCIEDDVETANLIRLILKDPQLRTVVTPRGLEILKLTRQIRPDLIMLDLYIGDVAGWEIYQQIRADSRLKKIPVIILSHYPPAVAAALGKDFRDASGYLRKPFSPVQLRAVVDRALGWMVIRKPAPSSEQSEAAKEKAALTPVKS